MQGLLLADDAAQLILVLTTADDRPTSYFDRLKQALFGKNQLNVILGSQSCLAVRFLRYEIEKGLRAV